MLRTIRSSPKLWLVWAALFFAYLMLQPSASSPAFWALATAAIAALVAQMAMAYRVATEEQETIDGLSERLKSVGAIIDLTEDDDNNVLAALEPQEWDDIFAVLSHMPEGARSLRKAILQTHPGALE